MPKIFVVGSFIMDNVAEMERFPKAGETVVGNSLHIYPGGKGINQCVAAARLSGDVAMAGMLGKDANGDVFRKLMRDEHIDADNVFACDLPTGLAQVQTDKTGQNRICIIPSANYAFDYDCLDKIDAVLRRCETVMLQLEMRLDVTEEIIRRAHLYGAKVLLNPAPAVPLKDEILRLVDIITPNETEVMILANGDEHSCTDEKTAARKLIDKGVGCVVVTLGDRGALIVNRDGEEEIPGFKVKAVDTVAAGDSFNGALAVALSEGKSLHEAVLFGNAMGALTVQKKGAIPSLHTRAELEEFLRSGARR